MQKIQFMIIAFSQLFLLAEMTIAQSDTLYLTRRNYFENGAWQTDTLRYPSSEMGHFLYGTTVLPSARRMAAASRGYWLDHVTKLPCSDEGMSENPTYAKPTYTTTDTTLVIDLTVTDNCCFDFLCDIDISDEGDLRLYPLGYGGYCACYCCFGLQFHIILHEDHIPIKRIYLENNEEPILTFSD